MAERDFSFNSLLIIEILLTEGHSSLNWIRIYDPEDPGGLWKAPDLNSLSTDIHSPLYYASLAGLSKMVRILLDQGVDVNAGGGRFGNPLQAASFRGHDQVVQMLL